MVAKVLFDMTNNVASLDNLHDIILPPPVSWWPPAPGWWVLAAALLFAASFLIALCIRLYLKNAYRRAATTLIEELRNRVDDTPASQVVHELGIILKRTAIAAYGREKVATLTGNEWKDFLAGSTQSPIFDERTMNLLTQNVYSNMNPSGDELKLAIEQSLQWLMLHKQPAL